MRAVVTGVAQVSTGRRTLLGAAAGVVGRAVSIISALVSVGIFSRLFDTTVFGAWMVLFSTFTLITSQDLGVCSSLRVRLGRHYLAGQDDEARAEFLAVVWGLIAISVAAGIGLMLFRPSPTLLGIPDIYRPASYFVVTAGLFLLSGAAVAHSMYAYLEADVVGGMDALRSLAQLLAAGIAWLLHADFLLCAVIFYFPWLLYMPVSYCIFMRRRAWETKFNRLSFTTCIRASRLLGKIFVGGLNLWAVQLLVMTLSGTDVILAGRILSLDQAAEVSVVLRLVNVVGGFLTVVLASFLGVYAQEFGRGNTDWIRRSLTIQLRSVLVLTFVVMIGMMTLGGRIITLWTGRVTQDSWLFFWCGAFFAAYSLTAVLQTPFLGTARVSRLILPLLLLAGAKLALAYLLARLFGVHGIMVASCAANSAAAILLSFELKGLMRDRESPGAASQCQASVTSNKI